MHISLLPHGAHDMARVHRTCCCRAVVGRTGTDFGEQRRLRVRPGWIRFVLDSHLGDVGGVVPAVRRIRGMNLVLKV
jgi:hypothetical protein